MTFLFALRFPNLTWAEVSIDWEEFCVRCLHPQQFPKKVGAETLTPIDIDKLKKADKNTQIKYKSANGVFMLGFSSRHKGNEKGVSLRNVAANDYRTGLAFDIDDGEKLEKTIEEITKDWPFKYLVYTTAKATKEQPRYRIIVPFGFDRMAARLYEPLARAFADKYNIISVMDDTCLSDPVHCMFRPICVDNGYFNAFTGGERFFSKDDVLSLLNEYYKKEDLAAIQAIKFTYPVISAYADSKDPERKEAEKYYAQNMDKPLKQIYRRMNMPLTDYEKSKEKPISKREQTRANVRDKDNFKQYHIPNKKVTQGHRTEFLQGETGRIADYIPPETEDKASAVRELLYQAAKACCEPFDEEVKEEVDSLAEWAENKFVNWGGALKGSRAGKPNAWFSKIVPADVLDAVKPMLTCSEKTGKPVANMENLLIVLDSDPRFQSLRYNEFTGRIIVKRPFWDSEPRNRTEAFGDEDFKYLQVYIEVGWGMHFGRDRLENALSATADNRHYNPVIEKLELLPRTFEDGSSYMFLNNWLITFFGCEDNAYTREMSRIIPLAVIKLAYKPGTNMPIFPVFIGDQGAGKSYCCRMLALEDRWFTDAIQLADFSNPKVLGEKAIGRTVGEIAEMSGASRSDQDNIKSGLTSGTFSFRAAYGHDLKDTPRTIFYIGTTNNEVINYDKTGARRYYPIRFGGNAETGRGVPKLFTKETVEHLYAEALDFYKKNPDFDFTLSEEAEEIVETMRVEATATDKITDDIKRILSYFIPSFWDEMSLDEQCYYIKNYHVNVNLSYDRRAYESYHRPKDKEEPYKYGVPPTSDIVKREVDGFYVGEVCFSDVSPREMAAYVAGSPNFKTALVNGVRQSFHKLGLIRQDYRPHKTKTGARERRYVIPFYVLEECKEEYNSRAVPAADMIINEKNKAEKEEQNHIDNLIQEQKKNGDELPF